MLNQREFIEKINFLFNQWIRIKKTRMENLLKIALPDEALYREIMLSLGYPVNKTQFLELSLILPFSQLKKFKKQELIEYALLYRAGFLQDIPDLGDSFDYSLKLDKSIWNFKKIRPVNYPDKRLVAISRFFFATINQGITNYFKNRIDEIIKKEINKENVKKFVKQVMDFQGLGFQRKTEMFFNIILPFFMVFVKEWEKKLMLFYEFYPFLPENSLIKKFKLQLKNANNFKKNFNTAKHYFAIIYFMKNKT